MDKNYSRLAMMVAQKQSTTSIIEDILQDGSIDYQIPLKSIQDLKNKDLAGCTALHIVTQNLNVEATKKLLKHGANITIKNFMGETALHQVVKKNYFSQAKVDVLLTSIINAILDAHVKFRVFKNPCDKNGLSHFHAACIVNHKSAVEFFLVTTFYLNEAIYLESQYVPGYTPLHLAAKYSNLETFEILFKKERALLLKNADGETPLHLLIKRNTRIAFAMEIAPVAVKPNEKNDYEANRGMIELVLEAYRDNKDDLWHDVGLSYFHVLCTLNKVSEIEEFLTNNKVDLQNSVKSDSSLWPGYTALHFAAHFGFETVKLLLKHGAEIYAKDVKGDTPFHMCVGQYEVGDISFIIESHPDWKDINMTDGKTLLSEFFNAMKSQESSKFSFKI